MSGSRWADTITEEEIAAALDENVLAPRAGEGAGLGGGERALLDAIQRKAPPPARATEETWQELRARASRRRERLLHEIRRRFSESGWWIPEDEQPPLVDRPHEDQVRWTWRIRRGGETREVTVAVPRTALAARGGEGAARLAIATAGLSFVARAAADDDPRRYVYVPASAPDTCLEEAAWDDA